MRPKRWIFPYLRFLLEICHNFRWNFWKYFFFAPLQKFLVTNFVLLSGLFRQQIESTKKALLATSFISVSGPFCCKFYVESRVKLLHFLEKLVLRKICSLATITTTFNNNQWLLCIWKQANGYYHNIMSLTMRS